MAKAKTNAPFVTAATIEKFQELREQRLAIEREAAEIKKQEDEIAAKLKEYVRANGGEMMQCERSGWLLKISLVAGSVSWKTHFESRCGKDAVAEIQANTPSREQLVVKKA